MGEHPGWGPLQLDPDAAPEYRALVCTPEGEHSATYLLEKPGVGRWVVDCSYDAFSPCAGAPPEGPPKFTAAEGVGLALSNGYNSYSARADVGLQPVGRGAAGARVPRGAPDAAAAAGGDG